MSIVELVPGPPLRGRESRLSGQDFAELAAKVKAGKVVGDGENVSKHSTAYQRAKSASNRLKDEFGVEAKRIVWCEDPTVADEEKTYLWALGPIPKKDDAEEE